MFGKIRTYNPELKMKDDLRYRGYYCGLCEAMSSYGHRSRIFLSHDCTFLYILFSSLYPGKDEESEKRCMIHPFKKRLHIIDPNAEFCAAVNILLGIGAIKDRIKDGQRTLGKAEYLFYRGTERKVSSGYPELASVIESELERLDALEESGCRNIDEVADTFAVLLGRIFTIKEEGQNRALYELGYQLGRWIYLLDAFEDRTEDRNKGNYNVFNLRFGDDGEALTESARFNILSSLNQAVLAYDLLDIRVNKELLDNIMYLGLNEETRKIFDKEKQDESI